MTSVSDNVNTDREQFCAATRPGNSRSSIRMDAIDPVCMGEGLAVGICVGMAAGVSARLVGLAVGKDVAWHVGH